MNTLKQILSYFIWTLIALLAGFVYTRIILGPMPESPTGFFDVIFYIIYMVAFHQVGLIIGSIVALLYIITDIFYLGKKLKNNSKKIIIRFLIILLITLLVGTTHYQQRMLQNLTPPFPHRP